MNTLTRSRIYWELRERRLTRKIRPFVLIALVIATAWMAQMIWATGEMASNVVYFLN